MVCNPEKAKSVIWYGKIWLLHIKQITKINQNIAVIKKKEICIRGQWRTFSTKVNDPNNDILSVFHYYSSLPVKPGFYCRRHLDAHLQIGFSALTKNELLSATQPLLYAYIMTLYDFQTLTYLTLT